MNDEQHYSVIHKADYQGDRITITHLGRFASPEEAQRTARTLFIGILEVCLSETAERRAEELGPRFRLFRSETSFI
ncbi:MAG: hypothetical protein UY99_C0010G0028 [Parcubacteria group bacterium GW2011_GWA1_59_11]|nr:MAG: hypothetical protein UY99_C0010G0028 [Parcubacteria group bacterium GW2011_GWA1_59_11]